MPERPLPPEIQDWVAVVVDNNADDLLRYLRRRVNHPEDAADLLGRTLLALWESGAKVPTSDTDARMWCFGIARNILREHHRHVTKHLAIADELRAHLRDFTPQNNAADAIAEGNLQADDVRAAVAALDTKSRELVTLVHWDGFSIAAAGRLLSMNESSARSRYSRALQRLERALKKLRTNTQPTRTPAHRDLRAGA